MTMASIRRRQAKHDYYNQLVEYLTYGRFTTIQANGMIVDNNLIRPKLARSMAKQFTHRYFSFKK